MIVNSHSFPTRRSSDLRVQSREFVVTSWDDSTEVLLEHLRVFLQRGIGIQEDNALLLQVLADLVVDNLRLVLRSNTCDQALLLSFWNTQLVVGFLDVVWEVLPGLSLLFGGLDVVLNVVEVDAGKIGTPLWHWLLLKHAKSLKTLFQHPLGLVLLRRNIADNVLA